MVPRLPAAAEILPWLQKIDASRRYANFGPLNALLEEQLSSLVGADHVVTVANGTLGLELALAALDLPPRAAVLVPALTFPATAGAIVRAGLTPFFADVDLESALLTPAEATRALGERRVAAVLPVALFGQAQDALAWDRFTAATGVPVLVDAAGAIGLQRVGRTTSAVFSLHATKTLAVGEGGFFATGGPALAARVRALANFGFDDGVATFAGTNAKLSEFHAAVGLAALDAWPAAVVARHALFAAFAEALATSRFATLLTRSGITSTLCIRVAGGVDDAFVAALAASGVETRRWYCPPLHRHPAFAAYDRAGDLGHTVGVSDELLGLPFHLDMTDDDVDHVVSALAAASR